METKTNPKWVSDMLPTKKMTIYGISSLSNAELLSILLNTGTRDRPAMDISVDLLEKVNSSLCELGKLSLSDLQRVKGIGDSKACILMAAMELGRRRYGTEPLSRLSFHSSSEVGDYLRTQLRDLEYEVFMAIYLNQANKLKHSEIISKGGLTGTVADPRIVLRKAMECNATSIILCHNHPSGNLIPSQADKDITQKIRTAAAYIDVRLLDHIIVSDEGYYSFADEGLL